MSNFLNPHATYPTWTPGFVGRWTDAELVTERFGVGKITERYSGFFNDLATLPVLRLLGGGAIGNSYFSPHPDFPSLLVFGSKLKRRPGLLNGLLSLEYRGLAPSYSEPPPPIYTVEVTTGNEPLSTHVLWTSEIAGTAAVPLNNSMWVDAAGKFNPAPPAQIGTFDPNTAQFSAWIKGSIFTGIEDYLAQGCTFKKKYTGYNLPSSLANVGTFSNPDGPAPTLSSNYAWFFLGATADDNAGVYLITESWKAVPTGPAATIIYGG